jgi:membrane-bound lytic murein transglycosylase D
MDDRTKRLICLPFAASALLLGGCGVQQQPRFRTPFLPPSPSVAAPLEVSEPPEVAPNLFLKDAPAVIKPAVPDARVRAEQTKQRAQQRFDRGKRLYWRQDFDGARTEFDGAVDLMLEAAGLDPGNREAHERALDTMVDAIHRFDLGSLGAAASTEQAEFEKAPLEDILQMTFPVDPTLKAKVKEQLAATSSQLPLSVNDAVLGYIHYFSNRGRSTIVAGLRRAGRYRPIIRRILDEEGVPQELLHLAQAESGFMARAVSRARAGGMWQFLTWRGQEYGLQQTPWTDDRMDPEKATRSAARHLRDLYTQFGDWYLAIAAYNCGPVTIEKAIERTGYADFWELRERHVIPLETTNYVPIILAMTIMEKNAAAYGIGNITPEPALEYDTVDMAAPTSLALLSDLTETPVTELAAMNPAVLHNLVPAGYPVHVPKGMGTAAVAGLELVPSEKRNAWRLHRVNAGETLAAIGQRYGLAATNIASVNKVGAGELNDGDRLVIPAVARPMVVPARKGTGRAVASRSRPTSVATKRKTTATAPVRKASAAAPASQAPARRTSATSTSKAPARKASTLVARSGE